MTSCLEMSSVVQRDIIGVDLCLRFLSRTMVSTGCPWSSKAITLVMIVQPHSQAGANMKGDYDLISWMVHRVL